MAASIGLGLALIAAVAVNWAYSIEHAAASKLPPLSPRNPVQTLRTVARHRSWLIGFGLETAGWLTYVAAVRLAPLALVQAVSAGGIAVLALVASRFRPSCLARHEQLAVLLALVGLLLLSISLAQSEEGGREPEAYSSLLWLGACAAGAFLLITTQSRLPRAAALGLAAGILFAAGDISTKLVVQGGMWLVALIALIACYATGTSVLQSAFQHGNALTAAGIATLTTNAVPIAAGIVLFREPLPDGVFAFFRVASFGLLVLGAAFLAEPRARAAAGEAATTARREDTPPPRPAEDYAYR